MFMKRPIQAFGEPTILTTDKAPALLCVFKKLKHNGFYVLTKHCTVKHLNNLIEQDHGHIKRRFVKSAGFQSLLHASLPLKEKESKRFMLYTNKREVTFQTSLFRRTKNYSNYSEFLKR